MSSKPSYKTQMKSDKKRRQRKAAPKPKSMDQSFEKWIRQVTRAVTDDDASALKSLADEERWSIWDIHICIDGGPGLKADKAPLAVLALIANAPRGLEALAEMAARADRFEQINGAMEKACLCYEQTDGDGRLRQMISAIMLGTAKGLEGDVPGFYLSMDARCPEAMRYSMGVVEDRPCRVAGALDFDCAQVECKRKIVGAIARDDIQTIGVELGFMLEVREAHGIDRLAQEDVEMFYEAAICCGHFSLLWKLFVALFDRSPDKDARVEVFLGLLSVCERLGASGHCSDEDLLKESVSACMAYAIGLVGDPTFVSVFANEICSKFVFLKDAATDGCERGLAFIEDFQLDDELAQIDAAPPQADRPSTALRM